MARILIVDDDPNVGRVLKQMLIRCGHEVLLAYHGFAALHTLSMVPIDLVITDICMPDVTGIRLIEHIGELHPQIKILAISGGGPHYNSETCVTVASAHGADRAMMKPLVLSELSALVEELLAAIKL